MNGCRLYIDVSLYVQVEKYIIIFCRFVKYMICLLNTLKTLKEKNVASL